MRKGRGSRGGVIPTFPRKGRLRLGLESLEDRLTPAIQLTYSGARSILNLTELVPGSTPSVTISEVAGQGLRIDLGGKTFDAASTAKVAGLTYQNADSPATSTFATLDMSSPGNITSVQATLGGNDLAISTISNAMGGVGGITATAAGIVVTGLDLSAAPGGVGNIRLTASRDLTVSPRSRLDAGAGTVSLAAGVNADGSPAGAPATLTIGAGASVASSNTSAAAITLRADDVDIVEGPIGTFVGASPIVSGSPNRTILGPQSTQDFAFDSSGNLYVADPTGATVRVYAPGATTPAYSLTGLQGPSTMAFGPDGNLYVADAAADLIVVYAPGATKPTLSMMGVDNPMALLFDPAGNLYVGNFNSTGTNSVSIFAPGSTTPTSTIDGISGVTALLFDPAGNLYVAGGPGGTVSIFSPGSTTPSRTITGLDNPTTLLFDNAGDLLVGSFGDAGSTVSFYKPESSTPAGTLSGFAGPIPLIYDPAGNLYVGTGSRVEVFAPRATAGGITLTTATPSQAMNLGFADSGTTYALSTDELTRLYTAPGGSITVGSASQTGDISLQSVTTLQGAPDVSIVQSPTGAGGVHFVLDGSSGVALGIGAGDLTVVAGTAGVFADNRGGFVPVIRTSGNVSIDTTGQVGTSNNTLGFATPTPATLKIGATFVPTKGIYASSNGSLNVSGAQTSNSPLFLYAATDLSIVPGVIVTAGTGKVGLLAGYDFSGLGASTSGTLGIGGGAGVVSSNGAGDAITLQGVDLVIATGPGGATVGLSRGVGTTPVPVAGGVVIRSGNARGAINLGTSIGSGLNLSNAELAQIVTVPTGTLTIGESSYRGVLTFAGATPITTPGTTLVILQRPDLGGSIVLDGTAAAALSTGGSAVRIAAGGAGITALGTNAGVSGTGPLTIDTAGPIGTAANRLLFAPAASPSSVTVGASRAPAGAVFLGGLGALNLGGVTTANAPLDVTSAGALNLLAGTVTTGSAAISLAAGLNPDGTPGASGGTLTVGSGVRVVTTNAGASAILIRATDVQIDISANPATIGGTGTGGLTVRTARADSPMNLGGAGTGTGLNLSNAELARLITSATGSVTLGDASRTGTITFSNADPIATNGAGLNVIQSPTGAGSIVLDGSSGTAIQVGAGPLQILAGTGGISAIGPKAGIGATGVATIDTAGPIGSASARVLFDAGLPPSSVVVGSKLLTRSGAFLGGLSSLTLGDITTADAPIDVTAVSGLTVAAGVAVDAGKGKVSLAAGRNPDQSPNTGGILTLASNSLVVSDNTGRDAITLIGSNLSIDTSANPAIVGARGSAQPTTPSSTLTGIPGPAGLIFDASGNRYIATQGGNAISVYAPGGTSPISTLTLPSQAQDYALDASGNLYVTSVTDDNILVYAPGATTSSRTLTGVSAQSSMAFDSKGNLIVADPSGNQVAVYKPGSTTPDISVPIQVPFSLVLDPADNVYVASLIGQVSIIAPDFKTVTTLSGASTPFLVALDPAGTLYVLNSGSNGSFVGVYPKGSTSPTRTLAGFDEPRSMVVDGQGTLYVGNVQGKTVSVFAAGATAATTTLGGAIAPIGLALDSAGNLYVINNSLNSISIFDAASETPTSGGVVIAPARPDSPISLGRSTGTGLAFADGQLANIYTLAGGGVTFGGAGYSGDIAATGSINPHPGFDTLTLQTTAGTINADAGVTISAANLALIAGAGIGTAAPLAVNASHLAFASASGPIRIRNSGDVTLTAVGPLAASSIPGDVFTSNTVGDVFTLLASAGVSGQINYNGRALTEGATFTLADGKLYKISYAGNGGENVTLTRFQGFTLPPTPRPPTPSISLDDGVLVIKGTNGDDVVRLVRQGSSLRVYASFLPTNAPFQTFRLKAISSAIIDRRGGDDHASVGRLVGTPVVINGGSGDDVLIAGGGRSVLIGGEGKDTLVANPRGKGSLVVAGTTDFDTRDDALGAIAAEWASHRPRKVRVANIAGSKPRAPRRNGDRFLNARTVQDDGARNVLLGAGRRDFVMSGRLDVIARRKITR